MSDEQKEPEQEELTILQTFPMLEVGNQCVEMLKIMKIENPAVMIVIADCDTGEMQSSANLEDVDMLNLLRLLVQGHEAKIFGERPPEAGGPVH